MSYTLLAVVVVLWWSNSKDVIARVCVYIWCWSCGFQLGGRDTQTCIYLTNGGECYTQTPYASHHKAQPQSKTTCAGTCNSICLLYGSKYMAQWKRERVLNTTTSIGLWNEFEYTTFVPNRPVVCASCTVLYCIVWVFCCCCPPVHITHSIDSHNKR